MARELCGHRMAPAPLQGRSIVLRLYYQQPGLGSHAFLFDRAAWGGFHFCQNEFGFINEDNNRLLPHAFRVIRTPYTALSTIAASAAATASGVAHMHPHALEPQAEQALGLAGAVEHRGQREGAGGRVAEQRRAPGWRRRRRRTAPPRARCGG